MAASGRYRSRFCNLVMLYEWAPAEPDKVFIGLISVDTYSIIQDEFVAGGDMNLTCRTNALVVVPVVEHRLALIAVAPFTPAHRLVVVSKCEVKALREMTAARRANALLGVSVEEQRIALIAEAPFTLSWPR